MINNISSIGLPGSLAVATKEQAAAESGLIGSFGELMAQAMAEQRLADDLSMQLALGEIDDVAKVMVAIEKATLSWQLMQQIRNKLLEAFQEIMRMQV